MIVLFSLLMSALALDTGDKAPDFELTSTAFPSCWERQ